MCNEPSQIFHKFYKMRSLDKIQKVKVFRCEIITFGTEILCGSIEGGSQIAFLDGLLSIITSAFHWNSNE